MTTKILSGKGSDVTSPHFEGGPELKQIAPAKFYATVGFPLKARGELPPFLAYLDSEKIRGLENLSEDLTLAALIEMIDYIVREHGLRIPAGDEYCSLASRLLHLLSSPAIRPTSPAGSTVR